MYAAWAGALFGFALSAKSWPIILLPVLLAMLPTWRQRLYGLCAAGAVPVFFLVTLPLVVDTSWKNMLNVARYLGEVRPVVGEWGWTAVLTGGDEKLVPLAATIGQVILYSTIALVMWLWWRSDRIDQTSAILLAFMIVTPRMGPQYLLWFVPVPVRTPDALEPPGDGARRRLGRSRLHLPHPVRRQRLVDEPRVVGDQLDRRDPVPGPGDALGAPRTAAGRRDLRLRDRARHRHAMI